MKLFTVVIAMLFASAGYAFDGAKYFKKNCKSCHSIGAGDIVGPDLAGLSKRRKIDWIVKFVGYPDGMINGDAEEPGYEKADALAKKVFAQYKPTTMPEFQITKENMRKLLTYIDSLKKQPKGKILKVK
jgi:cytochrome c2